jgi:hypothetical protein
VANVLYFPLRRICALGVPEKALQAIHAEMPFVAIDAGGASLQKCDLLVINERDDGASDLVHWVRQQMPHFPIVFWNDSTSLVDACRAVLFPSGIFAA